MYVFLWEHLLWDKSRTRMIIFIATGLAILAGSVIGIVALVNVINPVSEENINESLSQESPHTPLAEQPFVTYALGCPEWKKNGSDLWTLLETGDTLEQDSVIRTDEESFLDIRIQPGSVIRVMENTSVSLADFYQEKVAIDVQKGIVLARIKGLLHTQLFDFRTPTTVAGIRGTELIVSSDAESTTVFGMSGKIEVFNKKRPDRKVIVGFQEKSFVEAGAEPKEPVPMSPEEIERYRTLLDSMREYLSLFVNNKIAFLPNSVQLTADALIEIEKIYEQLLSVRGHIKIVGHTADIGASEAQFELSRKRAQAVMDSLIELGLPASKLSAEGVGSTQPVSKDDASIEKNRRVEFIIE